MNPALISAGLQFAGGIFGGSKRAKAARQMRRDAITAADDAVNASMQDQQSLINYRNDDERRLREASGYDLAKLRADAERGGFNPLTVLQATGAAGYDGRGAVLSTPFVSMGDAFRARSDVFAGTGQAVTETAGYFGDALTGLGDSLMTLTRDQQARQFDERMMRLQLEGRTPGRSLGPAASGLAGSRTVTASPVALTLPAVNAVRPTFDLGVNPLDPVTEIVWKGRKLKTNKKSSDASVWSQRYDEVGGIIGGVALMWDDVFTQDPAAEFDPVGTVIEAQRGPRPSSVAPKPVAPAWPGAGQRFKPYKAVRN